MAVFGGPRSPYNSRATRLLLARMTGASTMPSTTATSSGCAIAGSMAFVLQQQRQQRDAELAADRRA
jgi:hypothetical protein